MMTPAQWAEDPGGHFTHRWWDGTQWTDRVAIDGHEGRSPVDAAPEDARAVAATLRPVPPPPGAAPPPPPPSPVHRVGGVTMHAASATTSTHIAGRRVSSIGQRFLSYLLEFVLIVVTLGIGWTIWALITASEGRTPAKKLMNMQCVNIDTGEPLDWMNFVVVRGGIGFVGGLVANATVVGALVYLLPLFNDHNQHFYGMATRSTYVDV